MKPLLIYCYDVYCGWCYGFSPVMVRIEKEYRDQLDIEVLSGGMVLPLTPVPIAVSASYIQSAYKAVEARTGIVFGRDYLWHIHNPDQSDWFPHSEKPAVALCILKEYRVCTPVQYVSDLQQALYQEGRDLTDDEAYRHLLEKYGIPGEEFYQKLKDPQYIQMAREEFAIVKQLEVNGFPTVLMQENDTKFHLVCRGFQDYDQLKKNLDDLLYSFTKASSSV